MINKYCVLFKMAVDDIKIIKPDAINLYNQLLPINSGDYIRDTRINGNLLGFNQLIINQTTQLAQSNFLFLLSKKQDFKVVLLPAKLIKLDLVLNVHLNYDSLSNTRIVYDKNILYESNYYEILYLQHLDYQDRYIY